MQTAEIHQAGQRAHSTNPSPGAFQRVVSTAALALLLVVVWLIMHRYRGLDNDGQIYALQALARIHPALATDLYFQHTSQDAYTVFSRFMRPSSNCWTCAADASAERVVHFLVFGSRMDARACNLCQPVISLWLSVGALIIMPGAYGAAPEYSLLSDVYLTARLPAEARWS